MLLLLSAPVLAHDYWFERDGNDYVLYQGHRHSEHKGEARVPYDPAIVTRALCLTEQGKLVERSRGTAHPARFAGPCAALLVETSSYWSQTLTATLNKPKTEISGALRGWLAAESVKQIDTWAPALSSPLSQGLEIVPTENPMTKRAGDKVTVLVTWQGKPKSGVTVAYAGEARGATGADGQVNIRLRREGIQALSASFEEPTQDAKADKVVHATMLEFRISAR